MVCTTSRYEYVLLTGKGLTALWASLLPDIVDYCESRAKLGNQAPGTNKTFQDWAEQYSNVAYHYFRLIHYTEKLATKRDHMQRIIDYLSSYLEAVSTNTVDLEEKLRAEFGRQFDADENPQSNLMGVSPRSSISSLGSIERQNSFRRRNCAAG